MNDSQKGHPFLAKELHDFLIYLSREDEKIFNLFGTHITYNKGNLWIDLDPEKYSDEQSEDLYQLWDAFRKHSL